MRVGSTGEAWGGSVGAMVAVIVALGTLIEVPVGTVFGVVVGVFVGVLVGVLVTAAGTTVSAQSSGAGRVLSRSAQFWIVPDVPGAMAPLIVIVKIVAVLPEGNRVNA